MPDEHPKEEKEEWITAAGAVALLKDTMPSGATFAICARANDGMIRARAERFIRDKQIYDDVEVPAEFWWARGDAALEQNWKTGDFETWINRHVHLKAYGVSFFRSHIEKMIARVPIKEAALVGTNATVDSTGGRSIQPSAPRGLRLPEKVTIRWLVDHVPVGWWWALCAGVVAIVATTLWIDRLPIVQQWTSSPTTIRPHTVDDETGVTKKQTVP